MMARVSAARRVSLGRLGQRNAGQILAIAADTFRSMEYIAFEA